MKSESALNICRHFNYYLYRDAELITQRISSFSVNGITYHIPHVELIRALFALHKSFANAMIRPNGLAFLTNQVTLQNKTLNVIFTKEVPVSSLTDDFIYHIAWLISNQSFLISFESIYSSVYSNLHASYGAPLSFTSPTLAGLTLTYRGITNNNQVMILEVISIDGLNCPLHTITYTHPFLKERTYLPGMKKWQITKSKLDKVEIDSQPNESPREDTRQPKCEQDLTRIGFRSKPQLVRTLNNKQMVHQGDSYVTQQGRGGATIQGGIDESIAGGKLQPVDITSLNVQDRGRHGLEKFLEMIDLLRISHPELRIFTSIIDLPLGRKFSVLPNGLRRKCAVVKVERGRKMVYILEVACPDDHSLSTLILYSMNRNIREREQAIIQILRHLICNQGHWNQKVMMDLEFRKLRHDSINVDEWKKKIYRFL